MEQLYFVTRKREEIRKIEKSNRNGLEVNGEKIPGTLLPPPRGQKYAPRKIEPRNIPEEYLVKSDVYFAWNTKIFLLFLHVYFFKIRIHSCKKFPASGGAPSKGVPTVDK